VDSAGSTGSVQYVGPKAPPPPQQQPSVPQILPYHERRKLMLQRQQQQQVQQQQISQRRQQGQMPGDQPRYQPLSGYPSVPIPFQPPMSYPMDPGSGFLPIGPPVGPSASAYQPPVQPQAPPAPFAYPYGMTQPYPYPYPAVAHAPPPPFQPQAIYGGHPGGVNPQIHGQPRSATSAASSGARPESAVPAPASNRPPLRGQQNVPQPHHPHASYSGGQAQQRPTSYQAPRSQFGHRPGSRSSSSFDSSGDDPAGDALHGRKKNDTSPPPPPPPPPIPSAHVQKDSAGSVSSLGSYDRDVGSSSAAARPHDAGLFRLSHPGAAPPSHQDPFPSRTDLDYYRTNQAFLFGNVKNRPGPSAIMPFPSSGSKVRCVHSN
jgi:hypothetical protein